MNMPLSMSGATAFPTLGEVLCVDDPDQLNRVEVGLLSYNGTERQEGRVWARVAMPFAGKDYGGFFFPNVRDQVLVTFINGDSRFPVVVGSLWHNNAPPPTAFGGDGKKVDKWVMVGKGGTEIAIDESTSDGPRIVLKTPAGTTVELTDNSGGSLTCTFQQSSVTLDSTGISLRSSGAVNIDGSTITLTAGSVTIQSGMTISTGVVQCNSLLSTTVVSSVYTPGAGNVW